MSTTARRWFKACGCGCGFGLIGLGLLAWAGYALISKVVREAGQAEAVIAEVHETVGRVADYRPPPDGAIPPERMEVFLRTRERMADSRRQTEAALALLSSGEAGSATQVPGLLGRLLAWGRGVAQVQAGTNLIPQVIAFVKARGEALLETGMGPGEYLYIYSLSYYVALEKSPADGPGFRIAEENGEGRTRRQSGQDAFDVREGRRELVLRQVHDALLPMLRAQRQALDAGGAPAESDPWRERLDAEIEAMEADPFRIPWRDGLPEAIGASIAPYRGRLQGSYSAMCNPLEVLTGMDG